MKQNTVRGWANASGNRRICTTLSPSLFVPLAREAELRSQDVSTFIALMIEKYLPAEIAGGKAARQARKEALIAGKIQGAGQ